MERDDASVWGDIKKYQEMLEKDPGSYCFAPLADLYRKVSLFDDAIDVARVGCELHPDYVGGHLALGRAYIGKEMLEEGRIALEKVTAMTPGNLLAHKLLDAIYVEQGNAVASEQTSQSIPSQAPGDAESQSLVDSLSAIEDLSPISRDNVDNDALFPEPATGVLSGFDGEEIIEDAELIEELIEECLLQQEEDDDRFIVSPAQAISSEQETSELDDIKSPLSTVTMAELYVSQGFVKRAFTIYRGLLDLDPNNAELKKRLYELKMAIDEDTATARYSHMTSSELAPEHSGAPDTSVDRVPPGEEPVALLPDTVVMKLEKWLDAIQRRR